MTGSFLSHAIEQCHGRAGSGFREQEGFGLDWRDNVAKFWLLRKTRAEEPWLPYQHPWALGSVGCDTLWLMGLRTEGQTQIFYEPALPLIG